MSDYTILRAADAPDFSGDDSPGAFIGYAGPMNAQQLAVNLRILEPGQAHVPPGVDPATGHSHIGIEEIYLVLDGQVSFKLDDEVHVLRARDAVRIAPEVRRAARNDGDADAMMVMVSVKMDDPRGQSEFHPGFWDA